MPEVRIYIENAKAATEVVKTLVSTTKRTVAGTDLPDDEYQFSEDDVWVHVIGTLNPENVTIAWTAHWNEFRTDDWVTGVSQKLSKNVRGLLQEVGFGKELQVCADGKTLPHDKLTGFSPS